MMAELWYHRSISLAPGKDVKEEQGPGGQDGASDLSRENPVAATQIVRAFAFGLLLHPKERAVVGHLGDGRDKE